MFTHNPIEAAKIVNDKGEFPPIRGMTAIAPVIKDDSLLWKQLYDFLDSNSKLKEYFSLLPPESYHTTLFGLYTENDAKEGDWNQFVNDRLVLMQTINQGLEDANIIPAVTVNHVEIDSVIIIALTLDKEQEASIHALVKELGLEDNKIPVHGFHLTLAYKYKDGMEKADADLIKNAIETKIRELFQTFRYEAGQLCYFNSMTAFIPWNGKENPWINYKNKLSKM